MSAPGPVQRVGRDRRRLAAIVSMDVVGYSRLMGVDESGTLAMLKAHRRELIDPRIAEHHGRIVKTTGDGLLLEFPSVVDAVRCSVDIQRGMVERNAGVAPDHRIEFRIGINVGDIIIDDDDIFGDGVNVAARIQTLAEPGGICVSRVVRDHVLDKLSFAFEDLGAQEVKNIARPVDVYRIRDQPVAGATQLQPAVVRKPPPMQADRVTKWRWLAAGVLALGLAGIAGWMLPAMLRTPPASAQPPLSVAILPFSAAGGAAADEQYADSLTQDVTTALGRWRWATVASGRKVTSQKGQDRDARSIGRDLNVRYLVDAELRRTGDKLAITVRLIDAESATNAWSERLEFDAARLDDPSAPATRIARQLQKSIYEAEMRRVAARPVPGSAWDLVLRGDVALSAGNDPLTSAAAARKLYDEALRVDPNFVPAMVSVAIANNELLSNDLDLDRARVAQAIDEMDKLTARAVSVDVNDSGAWFVRASALTWLNRWDEARAANEKGQALDPSNAIFVSNQAYIELVVAGPEQALRLAQRASAMDRGTMSEEGFSIRITCHINLLLGRYADAVRACEAAAARGNWWADHAVLVAVYAQQGDLAKAAIAKAELLKQQPRFTIDKFKASEPASRTSRYLELAEAQLYSGLRKAGLPDR